MIDPTTLRKLYVARNWIHERPYYRVEAYRVEISPRGDPIWFYDRALTAFLSREELKRDPHYSHVPLKQPKPERKPLTRDEMAQLERIIDEKNRIDWRPTETIPEDYYGA